MASWPVSGTHSSWGHLERREGPPWTSACFLGLEVSFSRARVQILLSLLLCVGHMGPQTQTFEIQQILLYRKLFHFFSAICWRTNIILLKNMLTVGGTSVTWIGFWINEVCGNIFMSFIINFINYNSSSGAVPPLTWEVFLASSRLHPWEERQVCSYHRFFFCMCV